MNDLALGEEVNEIKRRFSDVSSLTKSFSFSLRSELNTKLSKSEMMATAIKLNTISCVVVDYNMMNMLTDSTDTVIMDWRKPIANAFL